MNNNEWIAIDDETLQGYNIEIMDRVNYLKMRCLSCGKTFGINPRFDGRVLPKDLICRNCRGE